MKTSEIKIADILKVEQFRSTAYADGMTGGVQLYSIGYGHQIQPAEQSLKRATIDKAKAMELFKSDLLPLENLLNKKSLFALSQSQFDALIDFGYNAGSGALLKVLDTWNSTHSVDKVSEHIKLYKYTTVNNNKVVSSDLVARRAKEALAFVSGHAGVSIVVLAVGFLLFLFIRS